MPSKIIYAQYEEIIMPFVPPVHNEHTIMINNVSGKFRQIIRLQVIMFPDGQSYASLAQDFRTIR